VAKRCRIHMLRPRLWGVREQDFFGIGGVEKGVGPIVPSHEVAMDTSCQEMRGNAGQGAAAVVRATQIKKARTLAARLRLKGRVGPWGGVSPLGCEGALPSQARVWVSGLEHNGIISCYGTDLASV